MFCFIWQGEKFPLLTLLVGTILGCLFALFFQLETIFKAETATNISYLSLVFKEIMNALLLAINHPLETRLTMHSLVKEAWLI